MSTALLVMANKEPRCLEFALPVYKEAGFDVYIHLDQKANLTSYRSLLGSEGSTCRFIKDRHPIFWGGFNMIRAECSLLSAALKSDSPYDMFVLVSDDTFPLLSPAGLRRSFSEQFDRIMLRKLDDTDPFFQRYQKFFFLDHPATSLLGRPIESSSVDDALLSKLEELTRLRAAGKTAIDIYYGSQWWALNRKSAEEVMRRYETDPALTGSFEFSAVPDELFVQTIVGNFSDRKKVRGGSVYVDWSHTPKPFVFSEVAQLPTNIGREFAFIRKVSSQNIEFLKEMQARCFEGRGHVPP